MSGYQWTPEERARLLGEIAAEDTRREHAAPVTGRGLIADLGASDEAVAEAEQWWHEADQEYREALAAAGSHPRNSQLRALTELKARSDAAWSDRETAVSHRDQLLGQYERVMADQRRAFGGDGDIGHRLRPFDHDDRRTR